MPENSDQTTSSAQQPQGQAPQGTPTSHVEQVNAFFDTIWTEDPVIMGEDAQQPTAQPEQPAGQNGEETPEGDEQGDETPEEQQDEDEPQDDDEPKATPANEIVNKLLDLKVKRHDEVKSVKEWIEENPELESELVGQFFDYATSKREVKEYLANQREELEQQKQGLDMLVIENLALQASMPLKDLEDFEADTRIEDPAEAFREYRQKMQNYIQTVQQNREFTQMKNKQMLDKFQSKYPDVNVGELIGELSGYLNATTSKMQIPFPEDALELFYKGKNFDAELQRRVDKAVKEERKRIYAEIRSVNGKTTGSPGVSGATNTRKEVARSPTEKSFLDAFTITE